MSTFAKILAEKLKKFISSLGFTKNKLNIKPEKPDFFRIMFLNEVFPLRQMSDD